MLQNHFRVLHYINMKKDEGESPTFGCNIHPEARVQYAGLGHFNNKKDHSKLNVLQRTYRLLGFGSFSCEKVLGFFLFFPFPRSPVLYQRPDALCWFITITFFIPCLFNIP